MMIHLRWLLWLLGSLVCLLFFFRKTDWNYNLLNAWTEKRYSQLLLRLSGIFLILSLFEKYSQFYCFQLNANDFWLFVDILEQAKKGGFFLTRFAPQNLGFVQHGSVHPMLTWGLLTFPTWIFGAVHTALWFNPVFLSGAGFLLGLLTRKNWGTFGSLLWVFSFYASTQVGKVLFYEVHPEAAYPFFVFLWLWSVGLDGSQQVRWKTLIISVLLGMGIKEDSFLVFGPWLIWYLVHFQGKQRRAVALSSILATGVFILQLVAVNAWITKAWGPTVWQNSLVTVNAGVGAFQGGHWNNFSSILEIFQNLVQKTGGIEKAGSQWFKFWISRPWLSLLIFAPWVLLRLQFGWVIIPLTIIYSLLDGPNHLWNYYFAPFLASFWFCASLIQKKKMILWVLASTCLLGSSSIQIQIPDHSIRQFHQEIETFASCLGDRGLVAPQFLGWIPQDKVWTERQPTSTQQWDQIDFVLISPKTNRFELSLKDLDEILAYLQSHPEWVQIGSNCLELTEAKIDSPILLFRRPLH